MKRSIAAGPALALFILLFAYQPAFSAEGKDIPPTDAPASSEETSVNPFEVGSQTIGIGASMQLPLFTFGGDASTSADNLKLGGAFSFQYQYFVLPGLAIGGTVAGSFNESIGGRNLFFAPLSFRTAYWWSLLPFELTLGAELGGYLMRFDGHGMLGPFMKVGGGAYWRSTPAWSIGLQTYYWLVPEFHTGDYSDLTRIGNFLEVGLTAVYHI